MKHLHKLLLLSIFLAGILSCQDDSSEDIAIPKDTSQIKSFLESERATMILKYNEIHASTQQQYLLNTSSSNSNSQAFEDVWGTVIDGSGAIFQNPNQPTVLVEPILDQDNEIKHFLVTWELNSNAQFRIVPVEQTLTDKTLDNTPIPEQLNSTSITSSNVSVDINTNPGCSSTTNTSFDATDCTWTTTVTFCNGSTYEWTSGGNCGSGGSSGGGTIGGGSTTGGSTGGGNNTGGGETTDPECIQDMTDFGDSDQPYDDEPECSDVYQNCLDNGNTDCWWYCGTFVCNAEDQALYDCFTNGDCFELLCNHIQEQISRPAFDNKVDELKNSFSLHNEIGYMENIDGSFTSMQPVQRPDGGHSATVDIGAGSINIIGFMHTHINDYEVPDRNGDGLPEEIQPIRMPSVRDIITFLHLAQNTSTNGLELHQPYVSMYSSTGSYTLRFTGDWNDIFNNLQDLMFQKKELDQKYKYYFNEKYKSNREKAFLKFIENEIGIDGINLFKIKNNGTIKEKKLNDNGSVDSEIC